MRTAKFRSALVVAVTLAWVGQAQAHHSFSAEFDGTRTFVVTGVLTKVDWTNPHIHLFLDVPQPGGKVQTYEFTSGPPTALRRAGIKRSDFTVGAAASITAAPAKDHSQHLGWLKMIKYKDGRVFVYRDGTE